MQIKYSGGENGRLCISIYPCKKSGSFSGGYVYRTSHSQDEGLLSYQDGFQDRTQYTVREVIPVELRKSSAGKVV